MKFKRQAIVVNSRNMSHYLGDFLKNRTQMVEFLDDIEDAQNIEQIKKACSKHLKYEIDGDIRETDEYLRARFKDSFDNKFFIYFYKDKECAKWKTFTHSYILT